MTQSKILFQKQDQLPHDDQKQDQLPHDNHQAINKKTLTHLEDFTLDETDRETQLNNCKMSSPPPNNMSNQLQNTTFLSSENRKLSAIQSGNSCLVPKDLKILNFCADHNKIFAVCYTKKIPGHSKKKFALHIFDLTSGLLEKIMPLWDDNLNLIDMCMTKIEHWQCLALSYVANECTLPEHWYICFINFAGGPYYTLAFDIATMGPMCAFDNKLLCYHSECQSIVVFDTTKWPIESNERYFDIGLDEPINVLGLMTCLGKEPNQRLVFVDYLHEKGRGTLCFDVSGLKLWRINDEFAMQYPCGDNRGNIFLLDYTFQMIFMRKDESSVELLLKIPAGIDKYVWSDTMSKMVVLHYNEERDFMLVSCYDIVEE